MAADAWLPHAASAPPVSTLVVNTLGSLVLGLLVGRVWPVAPAWMRAGLGTGLLGSFTTFSAITVAVVGLSDLGEWAFTLGFAAASVGLGLAAAWLGLSVGRRATPTDAGSTP